MAAAIILLKDIVIDPEHPIDLTALPPEEAIRLIKESFGFLSTTIDVTLADGFVTIKFLDPKESEIAEAEKWYKQALRNAKEGDYTRAVRLFERVVERVPNHVDARRNLAMAYLEMGNLDEAERRIIETLKLDPKDAWSYILLGNIYSKHRNEFVRAEKWYQRAYELNPNDAILLTNYGALMLERGNREQAEEFFDQAIEADPKWPHSYYALGLLSYQNDKFERAIDVIDRQFKDAKTVDVRSSPVFAESQQLYLHANLKLAMRDHDMMVQYIESQTQAVEALTGYPISIKEDPTVTETAAVSEMAWRRRRKEHIIRYHPIAPEILPHLLAHELMHIRLDYATRQAGRGRNFATTAQQRERAIRSISDHVDKLKEKGLSDDKVEKYILMLVRGLANQLYNIPLDLLIEHHVYRENVPIRPSQFIWFYQDQTNIVKAVTDKGIRQMSPPRIYRASITINAVYALFVDSLYGGKTTYAAPYKNTEFWTTAQRLFDRWETMRDSYKPGDEHDLVDEFAHILKLEDWYEWQTDDGENMPALPEPPAEAPGPAPQGTSNPELLKQKTPASIMYLLSALKRFDELTPDRVQQIGFEIAVIGQEGIDYADSDKKYHLNSIPGEAFSGLQLLCMMFVAFKRIDPTVDQHLDLEEPYQIALQMH
ncbi:MAG: tetratricopeptide repeat protein, partial [Anaerolineae bacterium]